MAIWEEPFNGRTWKQMPGSGPDEKKMNFALFRRGKLALVDLEKWEDGETSAQRQTRNGVAAMYAARWMQAALARGRRMEAERLGMTSDETSDRREGTLITGETITTMKEANAMSEITARQKTLRLRLDEATEAQPWGFKGRLAKRLKCSRSMLWLLTHRQVSEDSLDRLEAALDDRSWQTADGAEASPEKRGRRRKPRASKDTPPRAHREASAKVTIEDVEAALEAHRAAKDRFIELAKRYAAQLES